jgi:hypothetical protein
MRLPRETVYFDFADSADILEERFGNNIDAIVNGIQSEIDNRQPGASVFANCHRLCLIGAMRQWFAEIHRRHSEAAYERFAREIARPEDSIITFNYDVALDSKLRESGKWSIGDGYGFPIEGLPTGSPVKILKLHGSINWLAILFGGMPGSAIPASGPFGSRPVFGTDDLTMLGYSGVSDPRFRRPAGAVSPFILPTNRKRFFFDTNLGRQWELFWRRLWSAAKRAVQGSERIVVCGYGMCRIDRRGRNLLLRGKLDGGIEVCCGTDSPLIVQEIQDHGRRAYMAEQTLFEQWVAAH